MTHTIEMNLPTTVAELAARWAAYKVNLRAFRRQLKGAQYLVNPLLPMPCGLSVVLSSALEGWDGDKSWLVGEIDGLVEDIAEDPSGDGRFVRVESVESFAIQGYSLDATASFNFAALMVALFEQLLEKAQADFKAAQA